MKRRRSSTALLVSLGHLTDLSPGLAVHSGYSEEENVKYSAVSFFRTFDRT